MSSLRDSEHKPRGAEDIGMSSFSSLDWLQEFSVQSMEVPQHVHQQLDSDRPVSPPTRDPTSMGIPGKPTTAGFERRKTLPGISQDGVDYKINAHVKPPYSFPMLICMAMIASEENKVTLSAIYKWISDNFLYYQHADPTWRNSVRHSLSQNECFVKLPRQKSEPGKGGFWTVDPHYAEHLLKGAYRKTQNLSVQINPALQKRLRVDLPLPARTDLNMKLERLLRKFKQVTEEEHDWDPCLSDGTVLGSWPVVQGSGGYKRKQSQDSRNGGKVSHLSSSPLQCVEGQKETGTPKGHLDWDTLLDSGFSGGLSLVEADPLNPINQEEDPTMSGTYTSASTGPSGMDAEQSSSSFVFDEDVFLHLDWDTQLDSALSGGLSLVEGDPLSPFNKEEDPTMRKTYISPMGTPSSMSLDQSSSSFVLDEKTFLTLTAVLEKSWPEEEEHRHDDFLCSSTLNIDQLYDVTGFTC